MRIYLPIFIVLLISQMFTLNFKSMPTFDINIDAPPSIRFAAINTYFKENFSNLATMLIHEFPVRQEIISKIRALRLVDRETDEEILAASSMLLPPASDIPTDDMKREAYEKLLSINMLYEFIAMCTSMCVRNKDGNVIHARNFDLFLPDMISKVTYRASFYKNEKDASGIIVKRYLYESVMFAGLSGIFTVVKPGQFSITLNSRSMSFDDKMRDFLALESHTKGLLPTSLIIRRVVERSGSYNEAVEYIKNSRVTSPAYFTICGTRGNEGAVIFKEIASKRLSDVNNRFEYDTVGGLLGSAFITYNTNNQENEIENIVRSGYLQTILKTMMPLSKITKRSHGLNTSLAKSVEGVHRDYQVLSELSNTNWYAIIGNKHDYSDGSIEPKIAKAIETLDALKPKESATVSIQPTDLLEVLTTFLVYNSGFIYCVLMSAGQIDFCTGTGSHAVIDDYCNMKNELKYQHGMMGGLKEVTAYNVLSETN